MASNPVRGLQFWPARFTAALIISVICATAGVAAPTTLAVLPFENNAVTDAQKYDPLSSGLAAMLISDLTQHGAGMTIIERQKISALLKEIALSQTGVIDEATAVKAGKMLGAQHIAFGSFMVIGPSVRLDVRIIHVETSRVAAADGVMGDSKNFLKLEQQLAQKIAHSLSGSFTAPETVHTDDISAALYYSQGVAALDGGNRRKAKKLFKKCVEINPDYKQQIDIIRGWD